MKKQNILNLIKYYSEKDDDSFKEEAYEIAKDFAKNGDEQLADYIITTLAGPIASLTPQDYDENEFFTNVPLDIQHIYLPNIILNDVHGIINAIKKENGLNKFLLEGNPGTGKTETAKFIAKQLKKELLSINFNTLIDSKLGQSGKNIEELFQNVNTLAKYNRYIFLFDEIDVIALDRVNSRDLREMGRVTSIFLKELDKINPNAIILATTNLYKNFDRALTRRFDAVINFDRYSKEDLKEIATELCKEFSKKYSVETPNQQLIEKFIDASEATLTPGELKNYIKVNLAFSNPKNDNDYANRMFNTLLPTRDSKDIKYLREIGLTFREIEFLTGISRSTASRLMRGETDE